MLIKNYVYKVPSVSSGVFFNIYVKIIINLLLVGKEKSLPSFLAPCVGLLDINLSES